MTHEVLIVGLNHRTASLDVREAVAFADERPCRTRMTVGILQRLVGLASAL